MNMNSFEGKGMLALMRDGDYAHAGEEEAIERALRSVQKNSQSWNLDVGCGRGGSAEYLARHGWGNLAGSDRGHHSCGDRKPPLPHTHVPTLPIPTPPPTPTR